MNKGRLRWLLAVVALILLPGSSSRAQSSYYVNDASTSGDVYCNAAGSDSTGTGAIDAPYATLTNLLAQIDLEPGDTVYIDTGSYPDTTVAVTTNDQGSAASWVTFQGSTNEAAGGTHLSRPSSTADEIFYLTGQYIRLRNMTLYNPSADLTVYDNAGRNQCEYLTMTNCLYGVRRGPTGSGNLQVSHCLFVGIANRAVDNEWSQRAEVWNSTFYNNTYAFGSGGNFSVSNCVIVADGSGKAVFYNHNNGSVWSSLRSDYNVIFVTNGAKVADCDSGADYGTLEEWQNSGYGEDAHSIGADPLFADAANHDFHLKSPAGRYSGGSWLTSDTVYSPAIDAGDPNSSYSAETSPDGSRLNCGRYGNTEQASRSRTTPWIDCQTFRSHSRAADSQFFYWTWGGWSGGAELQLDISPDNGATWNTVTSGVAVADGGVTLDTTGWTPSIISRWRVIGEASDTNDSIFTVGAGNYYVNDDSTSGDIYCSAAGNDTTGDGRTNAPFRTLAAVIAARDLAPGDTVYIDTGTYTNTAVTITSLDQGSASGWVTIQGSTNEGATLLTLPASSSSVLLSLAGAQYIKLRQLVFSHAGSGGTIRDTGGKNRGEFVTIKDCAASGVTRFSGGSGDIVFENSLFANIAVRAAYSAWGGQAGFNNCTFYGNKYIARGHDIWISNCVIHVSDPAGYVYENLDEGGAAGPKGDYNIIFVTNGAKVAYNGGDYATLTDWQGSGYGEDANSLAGDPLFVDAEGGDFHLKSTEGHYSNGLWFADAVHSPGIDNGPSGWDYANEPDPNGERINIGRYGNTREASKTSSGALIECSTFNSHTKAADSQTLAWSASGGGWSGGATVAIDISLDNGATWASFTNGVAYNAGSVTWDTTTWTPSIIARWRIAGEGGEAADTNDSVFTIGIGNYYVNDDSTSGDIYCSAAGNDTTGDGRTNAPFRTLAALVANRDLDPGDTVYIDTGTYTNTAVTFTSSDEGDATEWLTIQGSTNTSGSGTLLTYPASPDATILNLEAAQYIKLRHLTLHNASAGWTVRDTGGMNRGEFLTLTNCQYGVIRYSGGTGPTEYEHCLIRDTTYWASLAEWGNRIQFGNTTFYNNTYVYGRHGLVSISNCIMVADGAATAIFHTNGDGASYWDDIRSDYNVMFVTNGAVVALSATGDDYATLTDWTNSVYGHDLHSVDGDPLFADAAGYDFHLKSGHGRYSNGTWVQDDVYSPAIDAGDTNSPYANEPEPNGERINCGRYGNTSEASKSYVAPPAGLFLLVR